MQVAVAVYDSQTKTYKALNEGDVNATTINTQGILNYMYNVLGISSYKVMPFGEAERMQFILAIKRQQPIVKKYQTASECYIANGGK